MTVMAKHTAAIEALHGLKFGIEIETVGISRDQLAAAVAKGLGDGAVVTTDAYTGRRIVKLPDGRAWLIVRDGSLSSDSFSGEVVTPICTYGDVDAIQSVTRELRAAGARVDESCGIHVHVGVESFSAEALVRLAKIVYQQEPLMIRALGVTERRLGRYTKPVDEAFIRRIAEQKPGTREACAKAWYGEGTYIPSAQAEHYHQSRYHGLNMHSVFYRGTVEFRYFEGTLHAGKIRAYLQLCLAIAARALTTKNAVARKRTFDPASAKYDFRVFLLNLGMIGDEFKTARQHLLDTMPGSSAWKSGKPGPAKTKTPIAESAVDGGADESVEEVAS